jgi:NAD(P)-dependent dehydrogenase (short-subunit alcohol dehydrogenase family)
MNLKGEHVSGIDGKVVVVTGAGRGIGRGEALEFARHGAKVIVNDLGASVHGDGLRSEVAEEVAAEIRALGGEAVANGEDVADWEGAKRLLDAAIGTYGALDVVVNNAGILRDRTVANMDIDEWDAVIHVHLRGTFAVSRHAASYWRGRAKAGEPVEASLINTSSASGIYGNTGQANYGAAKAGIASFTIIAAQELFRYGVRANAIAPAALTRMTEDRPIGERVRKQQEEDPDAFVEFAPENVAPVVVWLASDAARSVTGRVFNVVGGKVSVAEPWSVGREVDKGSRWEVEELDDVLPELLAEARRNVELKPVRTV